MPDPYVNDYDTNAYLNPALLAEQQALARRKAAIQASVLESARGAGRFAAPALPDAPTGFRSAVTGAEVLGRQTKNSILGTLTPLVASARLGYDENMLDSDTSGYQRHEAEAARRVMAELPRATAAVPARTEYATGSGAYQIPGTPAKEPTDADILTWAQAARQIPSLTNVADTLVADRLVKGPERQEAREERRLTREQTIAEARRKQAEDIEFKRWQTEQNNQMRADIAQLVHGGNRSGGGSGSGSSAAAAGIDLTDDAGNPVEGWKRPGVKANEIVKDVASDGTVTLTDKLTGQRLRVGAGGRTAAAFDKDATDTRDAIERSTLAISEAPRVKELLKAGSSSGLRADIRKAGAYVAPSVFGGKAMAADKALEVLSDTYLKSVPRFSGPTSDGDRKDYAKAAGALADTNSPPDVRAAALDEVVRLHQKSLAQAQQRAPAPSRPSGAPPSVRDSVKAAAAQHNGGWSVEPVR